MSRINGAHLSLFVSFFDRFFIGPVELYIVFSVPNCRAYEKLR